MISPAATMKNAEEIMAAMDGAAQKPKSAGTFRRSPRYLADLHDGNRRAPRRTPC
jgi:hypothetical protein